MREVKKSDVTYDQLDHVLASLDFTVYRGKNGFGFPFVRYENAEADAVVLLRGGNPDEHLNAIDLLSAQRTLEARGVIDGSSFLRLLEHSLNESAKVA